MNNENISMYEELKEALLFLSPAKFKDFIEWESNAPLSKVHIGDLDKLSLLITFVHSASKSIRTAIQDLNQLVD